MVVDTQRDFLKTIPRFYYKEVDGNIYKIHKPVSDLIDTLERAKLLVELSGRIIRPLQIWREQVIPGIYTMHYEVFLENLKQVRLYQSDSPADKIYESEVFPEGTTNHYYNKNLIALTELDFYGDTLIDEDLDMEDVDEEEIELDGFNPYTDVEVSTEWSYEGDKSLKLLPEFDENGGVFDGFETGFLISPEDPVPAGTYGLVFYLNAPTDVGIQVTGDGLTAVRRNTEEYLIDEYGGVEQIISAGEHKITVLVTLTGESNYINIGVELLDTEFNGGSPPVM